MWGLSRQSADLYQAGGEKKKKYIFMGVFKERFKCCVFTAGLFDSWNLLPVYLKLIPFFFCICKWVHTFFSYLIQTKSLFSSRSVSLGAEMLVSCVLLARLI